MNPYIALGAILGMIAAFLTGGYAGWEYRSGKVPAELAQQQDVDTKACAQAQQLTKDANDELQKDRDDIAARLNSLLVQHPASCVPVTSRTHIPTNRPRYARFNGKGISSDWLRKYAAQAKEYQSEVIICTDFLAKERQIPRTK